MCLYVDTIVFIRECAGMYMCCVFTVLYACMQRSVVFMTHQIDFCTFTSHRFMLFQSEVCIHIGTLTSIRRVGCRAIQESGRASQVGHAGVICVAVHGAGD